MRIVKKLWDIRLWQPLFLLLGTSWLWAPYLNDILSSRLALISQYELPGQPYAWLFRLCDIAAAGLLLVAAYASLKNRAKRRIALLLCMIAAGLFVDPIFTTTCRVTHDTCHEYVSATFVVHAVESILTALGILVIAVYDSIHRKRLASTAFVVFQVLYGLLFVSQLATRWQFNTASQVVYQGLVVVWLAWFVRDFLYTPGGAPQRGAGGAVTRRVFAAWAFANGLFALLASFSHLKLLGALQGLYFANDTAWLAQHGVIVGVVLLYLSRHLARGEQRARQLFLVMAGIEAVKYSVIVPSPLLLLAYLLTFAALFAARDSFDRGRMPVTWSIRRKDALFLLGSLAVAGLVVAGVLYGTHHNAEVAARSLDHFFDYTLRTKVYPRNHLQSVLLAHTLSVGIMAAVAAVLWVLFRPSARPQPAAQEGAAEHARASQLVTAYAQSPEDFFKLWPTDKAFFFGGTKGCVAYKPQGPVAFALADPVAPAVAARKALVAQFLAWCRTHRLRACFLPIEESSLRLYQAAGIAHKQIGASATVDMGKFLAVTAHNKWWRWQRNRAAKSGYQYAVSQPPHAPDFLVQLQQVSDQWLGLEGRTERGFALGYFDQTYLDTCVVHYLTDETGRLVAFANQVPTFARQTTATIDLMRHLPEANNATSYLLFRTIEAVAAEGTYRYFDLGFVPFAVTRGPLVRMAQALAAGRFSAKGLEQFKNKFGPTWRPIYVAYDGDLADLAVMAIHLEEAMRVTTT